MARKFNEKIEFDDEGVAILSDDDIRLGQEAGVNIKEIVLRHIKKISDISIQEFTPSYWSKRPVKIGDGVSIVETYHEDKRLAYCNAVDFLLDVVMAQVDGDFQDFYQAYINLESETYKHCSKEKVSQDEWVWMKLELSKKLFGQLMLCFDRISFFDEEIYTE